MKTTCQVNHYIHQPGVFNLPAKVTSVINCIDQSVIQCDVPVVENTFFCK